MIDRLIHWALASRLWVVLITVAVVLAGAYSVTQVTVDAVPDITNVSVMVNTRTGALAPEEIEKTVTFPMESELAGLPNVEDIRSLTKYGLSQIIVVFSDDTDIYFARQQVNERLQNVAGTLPAGVAPELGPVSTGLGEVYMYTLLPKKGSGLESRPERERLIYLRTVQDLTVRPALKAVPGVAEVESNGGYKEQVHININPQKMEALGINCHDLLATLEGMGENYGGGYIQSEGKQIIVRTFGRIDALEQIKNLPVKLNVFGVPVRVREIADVRVGFQQRLGAATYNGREAVLGTVLMRIGANSRDVSLTVDEAVKGIQVPGDVEIKTLYSRSFLVNKTIGTVSKNLVEGGLLVIAVLFLVLGNMRAAFIVALAIPVSMLFAASGMMRLGVSASLMSLGALDFGLIVDGSVVVIENIIRRFEHAPEGSAQAAEERLSLIADAAREVGKPVVLGLVIIMAVYVPILTLSGIEGKMFRPMADTVLLALGGSLLAALFLMPVLAFTFLRQRKGAGKSVFFNVLGRAYTPFLRYSLRNRWNVIVPTLIVALLSVMLFFRLGSDFIPKLDEADMVIGLVRDTSIAIDSSIEMQKESEKVIAGFKEVDTVFSRMGTPESATDPMGVNFSDTFVIVQKDRDLWPADRHGEKRTKVRLFEDMSAALDRRVPGQEISLTQPIEMRFNEILEGSRADITLRIIGPNLDMLYGLVNKASPVLEGIEGAATVEMDPLTALRKSPVLDLKLDSNRISRYGVKIADVNGIFETAMNGQQVGYLYQEDRRFPIVIRLADEFRKNIDDIRRIPISLADGGTVPISRLADLGYREQVTTIARSRARRYAAVSINLKNRDTESFVNEARGKIQAALKLPPGYSLEWGGQFRNLEKARTRLLLIIPIVLAVIFLVLLRTFHSLKQTLLVFNSIPFAVTGGVIFIWARGIPLSVSAGVGFIALAGIAILNGMVLVNYFNQLRQQGETVHEAVYRGTLARLRPVVMTALVASLGFIPMAYNTGLGAEVQRPLATVVIGGLLSSTVLTLLLLPTLYLWLETEGTPSPKHERPVGGEPAAAQRREPAARERKKRVTA